MSFRLVDQDGIAFEPEPRTGPDGVDLDDWAEIEGVPGHVWWNLRHTAADPSRSDSVSSRPATVC